MTALRVFDQVHAAVFQRLQAHGQQEDPSQWDVRIVMAGEKQQILAGVNVVFSRVIPLETDPKQHPLWQLAEQFGASCSEQCGDNTSHVVATHGGTEKVLQKPVANSNNWVYNEYVARARCLHAKLVPCVSDDMCNHSGRLLVVSKLQRPH